MHLNAVAGNVTILDLSQLSYLLQIGDGSSLELRDLVVRNYAHPTVGSGAKEYAYVPGLLSWPTITAQPGGALNLNNTTQYFWSSTLFRRPDCPLESGAVVDAKLQVQQSQYPACFSR